MAEFIITEEDKYWLSGNYPDLYLALDRPVIRGELFFKMYYSRSRKSRYVINPDSSYEDLDGYTWPHCQDHGSRKIRWIKVNI